MKIDKEVLIDKLLDYFYRQLLIDKEWDSEEYRNGYRKGMLDIIEEVNKFIE